MFTSELLILNFVLHLAFLSFRTTVILMNEARISYYYCSPLARGNTCLIFFNGRMTIIFNLNAKFTVQKLVIQSRVLGNNLSLNTRWASNVVLTTQVFLHGFHRLRGDYTWIPFSPNVLAFFLNYLQEISLNPKMLS